MELSWWRESSEQPVEAEGEVGILVVTPHSGKFRVEIRHKGQSLFESHSKAVDLVSTMYRVASEFEAYIKAWKVLCTYRLPPAFEDPELEAASKALQAWTPEEVEPDLDDPTVLQALNEAGRRLLGGS